MKIVYASRTIATTPIGEIGTLIAWSTTQRMDSPIAPRIRNA